jgi:hypothetical protein
MTDKVISGLGWIVGVLNRLGYEYQVTGGLAAHLYGSKREVYDIDIEVSDSVVWELASECNDYVVYGPSRYVDEHFDLLLMTLDYHGQLIDVCGIDTMYLKGEKQNICLKNYNRTKVSGIDIRVVGLDDLLCYKRILGREVDLLDIVIIGN